jgi:hypothetical protein
VEFLNIYIREAHPIDGWWLGWGPFKWMMKLMRSRAATDVYDPQTIEERSAVASRCETALQFGIRTYVDEMDDRGCFFCFRLFRVRQCPLTSIRIEEGPCT